MKQVKPFALLYLLYSALGAVATWSVAVIGLYAASIFPVQLSFAAVYLGDILGGENYKVYALYLLMLLPATAVVIWMWRVFSSWWKFSLAYIVVSFGCSLLAGYLIAASMVSAE